MRRGNAIGLVLVVVLLAAAGGWLASARIRSPAELAARTAAPEPSPILVPAEQRVLSTDVVTRGTARFGSPQQLALTPSALKTEASIAGTVPLPGRELREGDIVLTVSGRPVFLLEGLQPSFRDLGPGVGGEDVRQLEAALARLGFDAGPVDGVYDERTKGAVDAWYRAAGFTPLTATAEQPATIRVLETELGASRRDVIGARDAVAAAEAGLAQARAAHACAVAAAAARPAAFVAAQLDAGAASVAAAAEVEAKRLALDALLAPPQTAAATIAEIAAAQADLNVAIANATAVSLEGAAAIADAIASGGDVAATTALAAANSGVAAAEVTAKQRALDVVQLGPAVRPPTAAEIAAAEADLAAAVAGAATLLRAGELAVADTQAGATSVRADVTGAPAGRLADDLAQAERRAGVQVPVDELIFVPSTPIRVAALAVARGDAVAGALMTVTDSNVAIDGSLRLAEAPLVQPGMTVVIEEPDLGIAASGVVSRVPATPGTNGVDGFHIYFEVLVAEPPPTLVGASVRRTVPVESTGRGVLAVPLSALTLAADGTSRVQSKRGGALRFVTVEPSLAADGFVEVRPVDGALVPGDLVVIGFEQRVSVTP